ncbi:methionine--tRNA ligase [Candidatus Microgenomates bacterium]|nr:methionine--tRNA ligase [Candidatus Microgenomates bacterium]
MAKFFVTAAIPYVNDKPHIGTVLDFVLADVLARYHRQQGDSVLFSTGTDEHGGKILETAQAAGQQPERFVDQMSANFQELCKILNIQYDKFIRTTEPAHVRAAQSTWQAIAGDIYKGAYKGWYCTGCERFFTAQEVKANKGVCPDHKRRYEEIEEENYFFKLSKYNNSIKQAIEKNELRLVPESRRREILALLKKGLEDISVSRPKEKIPWGIEVPNDPNHVMYVWVEALVNYLTVTGYPQADFRQWWPADVHVIGKDIVRFHAAIWPAMLLAANLALPKAIYAHGFITVEGKKIGKSLGNAIDPAEAVRRYGIDALRFYLLHEISSDSDGDFTWERLAAVYDGDLANELGNLVQRVAVMVKQYQKGVVGKITKPSHDIKPYKDAIASFRFDKALDEVWNLIRGLNQYVDEEKPWEVAKKEPDHLGEVLGYLVSNLLQVARLLAPFLPETAARIEATFAGGTVHPEVGILFPKLAQKPVN